MRSNRKLPAAPHARRATARGHAAAHVPSFIHSGCLCMLLTCRCPPSLPPFPSYAQSLVAACLSDDHTQRPSFAEIQDRLALLLDATD